MAKAFPPPINGAVNEADRVFAHYLHIGRNKWRNDGLFLNYSGMMSNLTFVSYKLLKHKGDGDWIHDYCWPFLAKWSTKRMPAATEFDLDSRAIRSIRGQEGSRELGKSVFRHVSPPPNAPSF
jgi:hypothetical protein